MADPTNQNGEQNPPTPEVKKVEMNQEDLDALINAKYAKGAEKATSKLLEQLGVESVDALSEIIKTQKEHDDAQKTELQKANEKVTELTSLIDSLNGKIEGLQNDNEINAIAAKHGITEVDYFKHVYKQASGADDFNSDSFVETLLKDKGYIFTGKKPEVPNPPNGKDDKGAMRREDFNKLPAMEQSKVARSGVQIID